MSKLNGWQRIGVVLSVIWILIAFYNAYNDWEFHVSNSNNRQPVAPQSSAVPEQSSSHLPPGYVLDQPTTQQQKDLSKYSDEELFQMIASAYGISGYPQWVIKAAIKGYPVWLIEGAHDSVPVPIAWFVIYCTIWIFHWVKAGFIRPKL